MQKYDVYAPTYGAYLTVRNLVTVVLRRLLGDLYFRFAAFMNDFFNAAEAADAEGKERPPFAKEQLVLELQAQVVPSGLGAVREVVVGVIRVACSKYVYWNYRRRTVWKLLKGHIASAVRKLARHGVLGVRKALVSLGRGEVLSVVADSVFRLAMLPYFHHPWLLDARLPLQQRSARLLRHVALELAYGLLRLSVNAVVGTVAVVIAFYVSKLVGWQAAHTDAEGKELAVSSRLLVCAYYGSLQLIGESVSYAFGRPLLQLALLGDNE